MKYLGITLLMKSCLSILMASYGLALSMNAQADNKPSIPAIGEYSAAYLSTQMLLAPCGDYADQKNPDSQQTLAAELQSYPKGTCSDSRIKELIFKARFLQYASIAATDNTIAIFHIVEAQNHRLASCKNMRCLSVWLADVIGTLEPLYLKSGGSITSSMCKESSAIPKASLLALSRQERAIMDKQCGESGVDMNLCKGERETFLFATCSLDSGSNQVNFPSWVYQLTANRNKLLLSADDGPFDEQQRQCNGLPDLRTSARVNMGEYSVTIYRFDGAKYQSYLSYIDESIGGQWHIARYANIGRAKIACR